MATSSPSFGVVYPLWNHTRDPGNLLDRLVGEVGIDHITIPVVTGHVEQFRPFFFPDAPYFGTEGGFHYPPGQAVAATGVKPHVAAWCGRRDVLRQVRDAADQAGLRVHFRLDFAHLPGLCTDHPQLAATNAWGQIILDPRPCLSNPQFREFVDATCADLARYDPSGFQLESIELDFDRMAMLWAVESRFTPLNACFCSACRQIALTCGVKLDDAVEAVRERILRPRTDAGAADPQPEPESNSALRQYAQERRRSFHAWLHALARAHPGRACWLVVGDAGHVPPAGWERMLRESTFMKAFGLAEDGAATPLPGLCIVISSPARPLAADIVVMVQRAVAGGTNCFDFEHVECCLFEVMTALKQAIRYARRA